MRITRFFSTWARARSPRSAVNRWRPYLEALESRDLPSNGALLPGAPAPVVDGAGPTLLRITDPLETFAPGGRAVTGSTTGTATPQGDLTPAQLRQAYGFNIISFDNGVTGDGSGQTIAIVDAFQQPNLQADLHAFDQQFGLPDPALTVTNLDNTTTAPPGDWGIEISMDVEWAHALAPGASILLVEANDLFAAANYARQQPGVSVVSMSWGEPEFTNENTYDAQFATPTGHSGVTFVAASGDQGTGTYPAFSPNVLAVGGTAFTATLDAQGDYTTENGWSSSGGGLSQSETQPSYQQGVVTNPFRSIPDVAFDAGSPVAVYDSYDFGAATPWGAEGGTSLGVPSWAALVATADQGSALLGNGTLDTQATLQALYGIDAGWASLGYNDITSGNNGNPAGPGYDLVTGLGTPSAAALVAGLSGNIGTPAPSLPSGTISSATPTFQWSAVAGAQSYQLVATDLGTNATVVNVNVVGATSYTPASATFLPGHNYQWQVQALPALAGLGALSTPLSFTYQQASTPNPLSPADGTTVTTGTPTFQWSSVSGAVSYGLAVISDSAPGTPVLEDLQVGGTSFTPTTPLPFNNQFGNVAGNDDYTWYVWANKTLNGQPLAGPTSTPVKFKVSQVGGPTPLGPSNNATLTTTTPTFQWLAGAMANGYFLTLTDTTTNSAPFGVLPVVGTSYTPSPPLTPGHTYQWSLQAFNNLVGTSEITDPLTFTVSFSAGTGGLNTPSLIGPSGNLSTTATPTFQWSPVSGAVGYNLYLDDTSYVVGGLTTVYPGLTSTSFTTALPQDGPGYNYHWWVTAYDNAGDVSPAPSPFNLVVGAASSTETALIPNSTITTNTPTFQWSPVTGATVYSLSLQDDNSRGGILLDPVSVTGTSFTMPVPLINNHVYSWSVAAFNGSTFVAGSQEVTFTVAVPAVGTGSIGAPTLQGPSGAVNTATPLFQWSAVSGAAGYGLFLHDFSSVPGGIAVAVNGTTFTPSTPLLNGHTYQWGVIAYDNAGNVSSTSYTQSLYFTVGLPNGLATPGASLPAGTVTTYAPTFQWSTVSGASGYYLTLIDQTRGQVILANTGPITATSYSSVQVFFGSMGTAYVENNGDTYQWYVTAANSSGTPGPVSTPLTFTLAVASPDTPTSLSPSGGALVNSTTPTLTWQAPPGATGSYTLFLSPVFQPGQGGATFGISVTGTSYTPATPLFNDRSYQWQVSATFVLNGVQVDGPLSAPQTFTVSAPGTPSLTSPAGTQTTLTPTFQWSNIAGAAGYDLYLQDTTTNTTLLNGLPVTSTSYTMPSALVNNHAYTWFVRAYDSAGNVGLAPSPLAFNIAITILPPVLGNLSGTVNTATPTFQWSAVTGAVGYRLFVDDVTTNTVIVNGLQVTATSYTLGTPLVYGHSYQWWVIAFDGNQDVSVMPPAQLFQVFQPKPVPAVPTPTAPSGTVNTLTPLFQWTDVGASYYDFDVIDLSLSALPVVIAPTQVAGTTAASPLALTNGHTYAVQVQAFNNAGGGSNWSTALAFTVNTSAPPPPGPVADLIGQVAEDGEWWLGVSNGGNAFTKVKVDFGPSAATWGDIQVGDFDGKGQDEIAGMVLQTGLWYVAVPNGAGTYTTTIWTGWVPLNWKHVVAGDFNGDGKTDLAAMEPDNGVWWVALSGGNGFNTTAWTAVGQWTPDQPGITWDVSVGDFTGDGKADIAGFLEQYGAWYVNTSTGTAFRTNFWTAWAPDSPSLTWTNPLVGDFNGDGKMDIAAFTPQSGQWWVNLSSGASFTFSRWTTWYSAPGTVDWVDLRVGDFNGDGKADIAGRVLETGDWWVNVSTGSSFNFGTTPWATWYSAPGTVDWVDVQVGDFNGDGKADIAGRVQESGDWWVNVSTGSSFNYGTTPWTTWRTLPGLVDWTNVHSGLFV